MIAFCSSRVPAVGVYFVWPALIAATAASLMFCGVSKSGSPAPRSTTSIPSARITSAACIAASVDDAFISATRSETGNLELTVVAIITLEFLCVLAPLRESNHAKDAKAQSYAKSISFAAFVLQPLPARGQRYFLRVEILP